jgi:transcriptional regulator with XRE-family HTH domain
MTPEQTNQLADVLRAARKQAGLSVPEVSRRAGVDRGTLWRIEHGKNAKPMAKTLIAIGEVLGIPSGDLFAIAPWASAHELPTIRPYLRTKYRDLPPEAVSEIEAEFDAIARKHGVSFDRDDGPKDGEDE